MPLIEYRHTMTNEQIWLLERNNYYFERDYWGTVDSNSYKNAMFLLKHITGIKLDYQTNVRFNTAFE